ncbi:MAG: (d)CMP kinase [Clostridium sp.]|nr:(d)CMP kinase [Clostridium sp.]MBP3214669.1 (d)CMP kinase [Clostridium sp.]
MSVNIAIDGPAGAGKSSIAKMLASTMNYIYVDTGAMYRTLAVYFLEHDIDGDDEAAVVASLPDIDVSLEYENGTQQIFLNGENVTSRIRTPEVTDMASRTSAYAKVREKMVDLQRKIAAKNNVVMDGRDIGTVVLPDAGVKIFLTATTEVRANRRYLQMLEAGQEADLEEIRKDMEERDYRDSHRENSPLKQAEDAVYLDTSDMTKEEVIAFIRKLAEEKA